MRPITSTNKVGIMLVSCPPNAYNDIFIMLHLYQESSRTLWVLYLPTANQFCRKTVFKKCILTAKKLVVFKQRVNLLDRTHMLLAFLEPVALAADINYVVVIQHPIQDRSYNGHISEHLVPLRETLVGRKYPFGN